MNADTTQMIVALKSAEGAVRAFDMIIERYSERLYWHCRRIVVQHEEAEDVVQECFATLWEKINSGNVVINRKAYLYMTVRNRCLDQLRKNGLQTEQLKPYDTYGIIDEDDLQERSEIEARLWTAIDSLPEKCREVFLLSKRDGLKYEEIAAELGHNYIGTEHLLYGLIEEGSGVASKVLQDQGLTSEKVLEEIAVLLL